jgi:hypothetical protein
MKKIPNSAVGLGFPSIGGPCRDLHSLIDGNVHKAVRAVLTNYYTYAEFR